jgi:tetratricopeptide (TPR) repeat protein
MRSGMLKCSRLIFALYVLISLNSIASTINSVEYFDPFSDLRLTPEGKQLLELIKFADFDPELANQQLSLLENTGIENESLVHKVAISLAYITIYNARNDLDKVEKTIAGLHLLAVTNKKDWLLAEVFKHESILYLRKGDFKKSLKYTNQAIEISKKIKYSDAEAIATSVRSLLYGKMGNFTLALADTLTALSYFEDRKDNKRIANLYNGLVTLYLYRLDYENAIRYSDKALVLMEGIPRINQRRIAAAYINRAIALGNLGRSDEELEVFIKAQNLAIKINDIELITTLHANLSDYFLRYENFELARQRADKCLDLVNTTKNIDLESICLLNKGLAKVKLGQGKDGLADLHYAHEIIIENDLNSSLSSTYEMLSAAYANQDDFRESLAWFKKYHDITLTEMNKNDNSYQQTLETQYQNTVNSQQTEYSELKNNMLGSVLSQELLIKYQWWAIVLLGLAVVILSIFLGRKGLTAKGKDSDSVYIEKEDIS